MYVFLKYKKWRVRYGCKTFLRSQPDCRVQNGVCDTFLGLQRKFGGFVPGDDRLITFVSTPKPAGLLEIVGADHIHVFFTSFSRLFSMFWVSMEKPQMTCPGTRFSPRYFRMSRVRFRGMDMSPSDFLTLLSL